MTRDPFSGRVAKREARKRRGAALARRVSAVLKKAGVPKAGRYRSFGGYDPDGFIARHSNGRVTVLFTGREVGPEWSDRAKQIVTDAGFEIGEERYLYGGFDIKPTWSEEDL
jgi:hypothetical protein